MPGTLVVDNYDSFTFNLVHIVESILDVEIVVRRNDEITPEEISEFDSIIFSPGPGLPNESPALMALIGAALQSGKKVLGVCLGQQALALSTGNKLKNLHQVHHGVAMTMRVDPDSILFKDCGEVVAAGRYHSWTVDEKNLSKEWTVTCRDEEGEIMAMQHVSKPVYGIQFHPESVLTPSGPRILENFLRL